MANATKQDRDKTMGEPGLWGKILRKKDLESVFLFVTSRCNSNCRTCFNHKNLNRDDDLSTQQILKLSETGGKFDKLWLSGGEPVLQPDLAAIVEAFYKNNGIKSLNFPTNGIAKDKILEVSRYLLKNCPDLSIYLNFSLDGLGETHDNIRGVPGNFTKTMDTIEAVASEMGNEKNLYLNVATVVSQENYDEALQLASYIKQKDLTDLHIFETLRGEPKDPGLLELSVEKAKELNDKLYPSLAKECDILFSHLPGIGKRIARMSYMGIMNLSFRIKENNMKGPSPWGFNCSAGETTIVIDGNGDFRSCEMRPPIGNMKDYDYNLRAAFYSSPMKDEINEIGGGHKADCWCPHGCWIISSIKFSPKTMLFTIPAYARKYEKLGKTAKELPSVDIKTIESYNSKEVV